MLVKFFATYRDVTGCKSIEIDAPCDVLALLDEIARRWPALREKLLSPDGTKIGEYSVVLINGRNVLDLDETNTPLSDSDVVALFPLVAGG